MLFKRYDRVACSRVTASWWFGSVVNGSGHWGMKGLRGVARAACVFACMAACAVMNVACASAPSPLSPLARGSVGAPHSGVLTEPVALAPRGPGYVVIKPPGKHYGIPSLVDTIQYAAARVNTELPGPELQVGDLSGPFGGKIPNHQSHRTGRDVDFIFYATDLGGARVPAQGWTCYGPDGIGIAHDGAHGRNYLRLDLERNWLLVKALIQSPHADILWLFVSNPIKAMLTHYALARGEDPQLVWQAENLMHQPRNSLPHDDHFHVRIACPNQSGVNGCMQGGPEWPWLTPAPTLEWPQSTEEIAKLLRIDELPPL